MIKTSEYLYGCKPSELESIKTVAKDRILKAKKLLTTLLDTPLEQRDFKRIEDVSKAIKFYEKLMKEEVDEWKIS